ncbi:hypothetical protein C8J55DRAFT_557082 [Lentinula edodes]|uniref:Uncharacterized protein n=1 Tax=Lentinula lateritia TaxID=40482 RepID=A0A9W9AVM5_9AGAR|nr:hypothetical protein C8J55DRAFT_557082 [Lentinula edodes]
MPAFPNILNETVTYAKWKPCRNGMPGTMSCGKITVETLKTAKKDLHIFLMSNRKLTSSDYALRCMNVWEDPRVSNWIEQNRKQFATLTFDEFFATIWDHVLDHDSTNSLPPSRTMSLIMIGRILPSARCAIRMPDNLNTSVSDLTVQLLVLNNLLQGTPHFQSEENLKMLLIDVTNVGLREALNKEIEDHASNPSHSIHSKDFDTFTKAIQLLDNGRHRQLLMARQMAEQMICSRPTSRSNTPLTSSLTANTQARRTGTPVLQGRLPPLMTSKHCLLSENKGCFKCRLFFVKCRTSSTDQGK